MLLSETERNGIEDAFGIVISKHVFDAIERAVLAKMAQSEPVNWNWVDLQNRADKIVRGKTLWKQFIDGTPLANDIACWMADFVQEVAPSQNDTALLRQALEALEEFKSNKLSMSESFEQCEDAFNALKARLGK